MLVALLLLVAGFGIAHSNQGSNLPALVAPSLYVATLGAYWMYERAIHYDNTPAVFMGLGLGVVALAAQYVLQAKAPLDWDALDDDPS